MNVIEIPFDSLDLHDNRFKFRIDFPETEINLLAKNIETQGLLNPPKVRKNGQVYQIISGWERVKAVQKLGWEKITVEVYAGITDAEAYNINMADNLLRHDLSELEISNLVTNLHLNLGYSVEEISKQLGYATSRIYDLLKLAKLDLKIQEAVHIGTLSLSSAIRLSRIPKEEQERIFEKGLNENWTHDRYRDEVSYWKTNPFRDYLPDKLRERNRGRYHAFKFIPHPGTIKSLQAMHENIYSDLPEPLSCQSTITIPAYDNGFICPHRVEWVVASYKDIEPSLRVEFFPDRPQQKMSIEWIFLCPECASLMFPDAEYHPDIDFPDLNTRDFERVLSVMPRKNFV